MGISWVPWNGLAYLDPCDSRGVHRDLQGLLIVALRAVATCVSQTKISQKTPAATPRGSAAPPPPLAEPPAPINPLEKSKTFRIVYKKKKYNYSNFI